MTTPAQLATPSKDDTLLDGSVLYDPPWLAARIADTGRRWSCASPRVNATLWWYSASAILIAPAIVTLLSTGWPAEVHPRRLTIWLRPDGYLKGSRSESLTRHDPQRFGEHLRETLYPAAETLAALGEANPRALWAVAADSLAGRALWAGDGDDVADTVAAIARGAGMPPPRYRRRDDGTWHIRRCSCCLLYQAPQRRKCDDCPRRRR